MRPLWLIRAGLVVLVVFPQTSAEAWSWRGAPFDLRLGLALDRGSSFTDVTALSASMAYPYGSSVNPANDDFVREPPNNYTLAVTGTGLNVAFEHGASVNGAAASISIRPTSVGTILLAYSGVGSHDASTTQGDTFRLRSQDFTLGYSQLVTTWLALGGEFKVTDATLDFESTAAGVPLSTRSETTGYDARVGALVAPSKEWLLGVMVGAAWNYSSTEGAVAIPAVFGGPAPIRFDTFTRAVNVRAGASWRPSSHFGIYLDGQYLRLHNDEAAASVGRALSGIEYMPVDVLALRIGGSVDTVGKTTVSAGIGFYAIKHVQLELAYVYNAFPEVRREFGAAHLVSTSVVFYY